jgi:hypothetical protein
VNRLRIEHFHLLVTEEPINSKKISKRDEFVLLKKFKGEAPASVNEGWISGDGVRVEWIAGRGLGILYKYKNDAKKCFDYAKQALRLLYKIKA